MPRADWLGDNFEAMALAASLPEETHGGRLAGKNGGTLRSGKGGKGGAVKNSKQAIAIGLSEAQKKGAKVPGKASS